VWKHGNYKYVTFSKNVFIVSEELSSVETKFRFDILYHTKKMFQKNLVVWKRYSVEFGSLIF